MLDTLSSDSCFVRRDLSYNLHRSKAIQTSPPGVPTHCAQICDRITHIPNERMNNAGVGLQGFNLQQAQQLWSQPRCSMLCCLKCEICRGQQLSAANAEGRSTLKTNCCVLHRPLTSEQAIMLSAPLRHTD